MTDKEIELTKDFADAIIRKYSNLSALIEWSFEYAKGDYSEDFREYFAHVYSMLLNAKDAHEIGLESIVKRLVDDARQASLGTMADEIKHGYYDENRKKEPFDVRFEE